MLEKHADFVHLHVHSQYSLLDGACRIPDLVAAARAHRMPALALTDHGNLFGLIEFYEACMKGGIKPILGVETYVAPGSRLEKEARGISEASFHLILLAKDEVGYRNLLKLVSIANLEGFYYRPRIDKEVLRRHSKGLMCLSSCLQGEVNHWLARGEEEKARQAAAEFSEIFPQGDFYLEIQDHGIADQRKVIPAMLRLSRELRLPVVATNDLHYLERSQAHAHDALLCIQTQSALGDPKRLRFDTDQFYFKSPEEMAAVFGELREALLRTREVAEKANVELEFNRLHLPQFIPPDGKTQEATLREQVEEGIRRRYPSAAGPKLRARVEHELAIIAQTGFTSYFLITWDFVRYAKGRGIPVGPGRGSAAGSVVSYCLGITDLDPLEHDLLFERFLNADRISMPDIDIDFCYERRGEVIEYVVQKYGQGNVAQVITFGTMQAKAVVRDVARVMGFSYPEADRIAKLIPFELNMTLRRALEMVPELKSLAGSDPRVQELLDTSMLLEGLTRHASTHAAGVVIADGDLTDHVPLYKTSDGQISTGYAMESLEKIGLLKMDFLGLRTLTVIEEASKLVREAMASFDIEKISLDDARTYESLSRGETAGIFQLESSGMRDLVRRLKPQRFQDLIALVALFRPGPLGSGMVDDFIRRRNGQVKVAYDHPRLEPILRDTCGVYIFQEQVMRIAHELAGFTLSEADGLRKAMGKKTPEVMGQAREKFITGCVRNRIDRRAAQRIFEKIEYFAGYAFNRSHSAAYALISYRTAFLKANFPIEFMTALLSSERDNTEKVAQYVEEARRMGIVVLAPDVHRSHARFTVETVHPSTSSGRTAEGTPVRAEPVEARTNAIRYGLLAIKNVGEKAIDCIVESRRAQGPFSSLADLCERVDTRAVNRKVMESFIKCGAFDGLGLRRSQMMAVLDSSMDLGSRRQRDKGGGQLSFFDVFGSAGSGSREGVPIPDLEEWTQAQRLAFEKSVLGFYLTGHPLDAYRPVLALVGKITTSDLPSRRDGEEVTLAGVISRLKVTTTKKGNERMAILSFEDFHGSVEVLVFPKAFLQVESNLKPDAVVFVRGKVSLREERPRLLADEVAPLEEVWDRRAAGLRIRLSKGVQRSTLETLRRTLGAHPGPLPVELAIGDGNGGDVRVTVGSTLHVQPSLELFQTLVDLVGHDSITLKS